MKTWSYKTITRKAETKIISIMAKSETAEADFERRMYQHWAYGVFLGWKNLTMGWQNEDDCDLMESLTKGREAP